MVIQDLFRGVNNVYPGVNKEIGRENSAYTSTVYERSNNGKGEPTKTGATFV